MRKILKKTGRYAQRFTLWMLAFSVAVLMLTQFVFWNGVSWLNSKAGQSYVQARLEEALKDSPYRIKMSGFSYALPTHLHIDGADIYEGKRLLLNAKSVRLRLDTSFFIERKFPIDLKIKTLKAHEQNITMRDVSLKAYLLRDDFVITSLSMMNQTGGTLTGNGRFNIANNSADLAVKAKKLHILKDDMVDGIINADITLKGQSNAYILGGVIQPVNLAITLPEKVSQSIPELNIQKPGQTRQSVDTGKNITLDIVMDAPKKIFVRGWGLDSEFGGKLKITGTPNDAYYDGSLNLIRGRYSDFGKNFNITKAKLKFSGTVPPNPSLDIVAETKVKDILAQILITGNATKPKIDFSSVPPKPNDEVLAYILFGQTIDKLSPLQAIQLTQSLQRLSGQAAPGGGFDPVGTLRSATGLDDLTFELDDTGQASVGAGKYLSDNVYLEFETGADPGSSNANVEIEVTPNITIESEIGQDARTGAGVFWKWDY